MATSRYFEGFIDYHPSYQVNCNICESDVAMFYDIEVFESVCLDCCDDIWFARMEMKTVSLYVDNWKK